MDTSIKKKYCLGYVEIILYSGFLYLLHAILCLKFKNSISNRCKFFFFNLYMTSRCLEYYIIRMSNCWNPKVEIKKKKNTKNQSVSGLLDMDNCYTSYENRMNLHEPQKLGCSPLIPQDVIISVFNKY